MKGAPLAYRRFVTQALRCVRRAVVVASEPGNSKDVSNFERQNFFTKSKWWFQSFFIFTPIPLEMIQFDEHIFQMGWNHQLV